MGPSGEPLWVLLAMAGLDWPPALLAQPEQPQQPEEHQAWADQEWLSSRP